MSFESAAMLIFIALCINAWLLNKRNQFNVDQATTYHIGFPEFSLVAESITGEPKYSKYRNPSDELTLLVRYAKNECTPLKNEAMYEFIMKKINIYGIKWNGKIFSTTSTDTFTKRFDGGLKPEPFLIMHFKTKDGTSVVQNQTIFKGDNNSYQNNSTNIINISSAFNTEYQKLMRTTELPEDKKTLLRKFKNSSVSQQKLSVRHLIESLEPFIGITSNMISILHNIFGPK